MQTQNTQEPLIPVVMSGGSGTRLWPMSRELYPKQFLPILDGQSLFQQTLLRMNGQVGISSPIVVCNNEHRFMAAEQLRKIGVEGSHILLEPIARSTAPAIAVAAFEALEMHKEAVLLVLPADHMIPDTAVFRSAVEAGFRAAQAGKLVTFGIVPTRAETGYGYIRQGSAEDIDGAAGSVFMVDAFVEKPDEATAKEYVDAGTYYWNSGIFMFTASRYLEELKKHAEGIYQSCKTAHEKRSGDLDFIRIDEEAFKASPSDSIDYAVMEKTDAAVVIPLDAGWSDVGSWHSLWDVGSQNEAGNVEIGDVVTHDCEGCYINAGHRMVTAVGMKDHVVVETADAILVAPRERAQEVKSIVEKLKAEGRDEAILHRKVYRPWGAYEGIDQAERFQVKRITVNPGERLSLQMHHHRAEHWIIVSGTARVTRNEDVFLLSENESTYIPVGTKHRLENPGKIPLELIEVQSGAYLGEDDILRFDDIYGRSDDQKEEAC